MGLHPYRRKRHITKQYEKSDKIAPIKWWRWRVWRGFLEGLNDDEIAERIGCDPALVGVQIEVWHDDGTMKRKDSGMSRHSFDPEIAEKVGLNAAVIYQNIYWWCERNAINERNIRDGKAWTYNTLATFSNLFPYLTAKQIRLALDKLKDADLIVSGSYNKAQETARFGTQFLPISICPKGQPHLPKRAQHYQLVNQL